MTKKKVHPESCTKTCVFCLENIPILSLLHDQALITPLIRKSRELQIEKWIALVEENFYYIFSVYHQIQLISKNR